VAERRDDIVAVERAQIAIEMMSPNRTWGSVTQLAKAQRLSRQTLYDMATKGRDALVQAMSPEPHGPQPRQHNIVVTKNQLQRGVLALSEQGVSQRGVKVCLSEMLDTNVSLGWVNGTLSGLEKIAQQVNQQLKPVCQETLAGDEMFANGLPNLLVVGNDSLYIYALTRQDGRDGDTWGCVLLDMPETKQFASDAGTGLAAGVQTAEWSHHQLDWDHLLRPMWGQATRLEEQAYSALTKVEERESLFIKAQTNKRLQQHLAKWEILEAEADKKIERLDAFSRIARHVDDYFALIDLETGELLDADKGIDTLQCLGEQMSSFSGRIYQKLASNLKNWAQCLFTYQALLSPEMAVLTTKYGSEAITALCRIWQCEADEKRHRLALPEKEKRQQIWQQSFEAAYLCLGDTRFGSAWEEVSTLLSHPWRGSMLAECVNSLLRPILDRRKHTDQGCLDLFRFLHNVRPFLRGKRAGQSPSQLVGICLPDDPLSLLGLSPKVSS